jgi:site-specific DNA recombinase
MKYQKEIKRVAVYLRKSREDENEADTLLKHRIQLLDFVKSKGWEYEVYEEIGSSDTIEFRPKFSRLLQEVERGVYDAVVVVAFDRITRGDTWDYARIKAAFAKNQTLIVTPYGDEIDLSDNTNILNDIMATISRAELVRTKQRLHEGKKRGARLGHWVNGPAPLGYDYDRNTKKLKVNSEEKEIIRLIFDKYLAGEPMYEIAFYLNNLGYRTKNGSYFQDAQIQRILTNLVYTGTVVYGKTEGSGHLNRKTKPLRVKDEDEWIVTPNAHEPIVTQEEFNKVQRMMALRNRVPVKARQGAFALSGLLRCGKCGYAMRFTYSKKKKGTVVYVAKCQKSDPFGNRCGNQGIELNVLLQGIEGKIVSYFRQLDPTSNDEEYSKRLERFRREIAAIQKEIKNVENAKERIEFLFIKNRIDIDRYDELIEEENRKLDKLNKELKNLERQFNKTKDDYPEERYQRLKNFISNYSIFNEPNQVNQALKTIIDRIYYTRDGDNIRLEIIYL